MKNVQQDVLLAMSDAFTMVVQKSLTFRHHGGQISPAKYTMACAQAIINLKLKGQKTVERSVSYD